MANPSHRIRIDAGTITSAQSGNLESFEKIVVLCQKAVYNFIYRMVSKKEDAEDLTQETFFKIYKNIHRYKPEYKFTTWIFTIANRTVYDFLRRKKVRPELYILDAPNSRFETGAVDRAYKIIEGRIDINRALGQLSPKYRMVILLYYWQELSYKEIAKSLEIPLNTVKTYLSRSKKILRKILGDEK